MHFRCYLVIKPSSNIFWFYTIIDVFPYRKIPKISPSNYKPPETNPPLNRPAKYKPPTPARPGACSSKIALEYQLKQSKNGKFTSNYKASPIDVETQVSLRR